MLYFIVLLGFIFVVNGFAVDTTADMGATLQELQYLVTMFTNMTVIDSIAFKTQLHLLVDEIRYEPEGKFGTEIAKLSYRAQIFFQAGNLTDPDWPPKYTPVVPVENEIPTDESRRSDTLSKRSKDNEDNENYYVLAMYEDTNCGGMSHVGIKVRPYTCYTITREAINSARVIDYMGVSYFEMFYENCSTPIKQRVSCPFARTATCYQLKTGNSFKWGKYIQLGFGLKRFTESETDSLNYEPPRAGGEGAGFPASSEHLLDTHVIESATGDYVYITSDSNLYWTMDITSLFTTPARQ